MRMFHHDAGLERSQSSALERSRSQYDPRLLFFYTHLYISEPPPLSEGTGGIDSRSMYLVKLCSSDWRNMVARWTNHDKRPSPYSAPWPAWNPSIDRLLILGDQSGPDSYGELCCKVHNAVFVSPPSTSLMIASS